MVRRPEPELAIFDCDGVLVDSEPIANRIMVEMLNEAGFPLTLEQSMRDLVGLSLASCWKLLEARFGRPVPADFEQRLQTATFAAFSRELKPVPGIEAALDELGAAGIALCVASSGAPEKIRHSLTTVRLIDRFAGRLFSATQVARGKPHPDLFLHAAAALGVEPGRAVVIEDAVPGVVGAVAAGMRAIAYAGAAHANRAGLVAAGGELLDQMSDLPRRLGLRAA